MKTTESQITLKVASQLKQQTMKKAKAEGMTLKALLVLAMKGYVNGELRLGLHPQPSAYMKTKLQGAEKDMVSGNILSYPSVDDAIAGLQ